MSLSSLFSKHLNGLNTIQTNEELIRENQRLYEKLLPDYKRFGADLPAAKADQLYKLVLERQAYEGLIKNANTIVEELKQQIADQIRLTGIIGCIYETENSAYRYFLKDDGSLGFVRQ